MGPLVSDRIIKAWWSDGMAGKVLIIEDDEDIARLVEMHLKDAGYQVSPAYDGETGLDRALSNHWDLIILDLMLPGVDGLRSVGR